MKKSLQLLSIVLTVLTTLNITAQNGINYKALIKDDSGNVVVNGNTFLSFTILKGAAQEIVYSETHSTSTDENGIIILNIGEGNPFTGNFDDVDWNSDDHFLMVIINNVNLGITQFKTVPYALNAANVKGLEAIDEGNGIGWRLVGRNPNNYASIGLNAVDLSSSYAPGDFDGAQGNNSFAQGVQSRASGNSSVAFGNLATASGTHSMSLGSQSRASGDYSFAGPEASAGGDYSVALGNGASASGFNSVALGPSCWIQAASSFGAGYGHRILPNSNVSIALGFENANRANNTVTIGYRLWADSYQSIVLGSYNTVIPASESIFLPNDPLLQVGNGTSFSNRSTALMILKNGNVGIGTNTPQELLHISGGRLRIGTETIEDTGSNRLSFNADLLPDANNAFRLGNASDRWIGVWTINGVFTTSDRRSKTNIVNLNYGLEDVMKLNPVSFNWKKSPNDDTKLGLIAQDLLKVIPEVVKTHDWETDENGNKTKKASELMSVNYSDLIPVLIKAIQEQQKIIGNQNTKIEGLTSELTALKSMNTRIKALEQQLKTATQ